MKEINGSITNYSNKGFESLNRDMLQDTDLSLEAIGLLTNIISYPSNWKLYKTELYSRFKKNKRTCIDRIWEELMEHGYLIQFRKRVGKRYDYQYLISPTKFTRDEILKIISEVSKNGYTFYHKNMLKVDDTSTIDPIDFIMLKNDNTVNNNDLSRNQLEPEPALNLHEIKSSIYDKCGYHEDLSTVENQQLNLNNLKESTNKLIKQKLTIQNNDDDDDNIFNKEPNTKLTHNQITYPYPDLATLISNSQELLEISKILIHAGALYQDVFEIIRYLKNKKQKVNILAIEQQILWMKIQGTTEKGISSFHKYFINGYEKRCQNTTIKAVYSFDRLKEVIGEKEVLPKIPMFNWLK